jgi:hypothetical protein
MPALRFVAAVAALTENLPAARARNALFAAASMHMKEPAATAKEAGFGRDEAKKGNIEWKFVLGTLKLPKGWCP